MKSYCACAVAFLALASQAVQTNAQEKQRQIGIEDIYGYWTFIGASPNELQSLPDGKSYTQLSEDGTLIETYDYATGKKTGVLVDVSKIRDNDKLESIEGYEVSATGEYVLLYQNKRRIYRRSFTADYYVYDVAHRSLMPLTKEGGEQEAAFAPSGYVVSFVQDNNLKLYKIKYQSVSNVTTDGKFGSVINGIPDWVNEEEFTTKRSYAWSPDSKLLAYVRYDESNVPIYRFPVYKGWESSDDGQGLYPTEYAYKYPKAGEKNATVSVRVYDVDSRTTKDVDLGEKEPYVPRILWTGKPDQLAVVKLNRLQNKMDILAVNARSTVSTTMYTDRNKCYVEETSYRNMLFIKGGDEFIILNEQDGYNHLYLYGGNGVLKQKLTDGPYDVTELYGYDEETQTLFYQAAGHNPIGREVYCRNLKTGKTTQLTPTGGTWSADYSTGCKFAIFEHSDVKTPPVFTVVNGQGKTLRTLEDNARLANYVKDNLEFSPKEFFKFSTSDGTQLNGWMVRPLGFDPGKKYPALIVQYSGPDSQNVLDEWSVDWEQTLAAEGFLVVCVDPRGTGARGEAFRKVTYQKLGKVESDDIIEAARYVGELPYADASRIGIWGWSYGGFMSTLCLCRSSLFKVGIAVAPVVNWRFYDTIYTERYMRTPQQNPSGYDDNSPVGLASRLHGRYFIIHGSADDNVHYQNQMEMVDALIRADKQFDMFTYPNRNHGIYGGNTRVHLYTMMLNYLKNNL